MTDHVRDTDETRFTAELTALAGRLQPDPTFVDTLEDRLRAAARDGAAASSQAVTPLRRWRIPLTLAAALILALALIFAVPELRTLAQDILQFFIRADSDSFVAPTPSGETAAVISGIEVASPAEAAAALDRPVLGPSVWPVGYGLQRITYDPARAIVWIEAAAPPGRGLIITQWPASESAYTDAKWGQIGASAPVSAVEVRGTTGEYVEGAFILRPRAKEATWEESVPSRRLRWQEGDTMFEIYAQGGAPDGSYTLTTDDMLALAASLQ